MQRSSLVRQCVSAEQQLPSEVQKQHREFAIKPDHQISLFYPKAYYF